MAAAEFGALELPRDTAMSGSDPVARARALVPLLEAAGPAIEAARELTPEVLEALYANDFFRLLTPASLGGAALPLDTFAAITEALAVGDASVGWCINQGNVSVMSSATYLDPEVAQRFFSDRRSGLAWGARHGRARAVEVEGGYRVTGSWDFASGSRHALLLGAHVPVVLPDGTPRNGPNGKPEDVTVIFPKEQARIIGDWASLGLRGTGSDTYELDGLFVPEAHACFRDRVEGRRQFDTISLFTSHLCYAAGFAGVALGAARGLLNQYVALARGKTARAGAQPMAENHCIQSEVAQLEARLRAVRMYLLGTLEEAWAEAEATGTLSLDARMAVRLATTSAMRDATDVSVACYRAAGTTAVLESNPFERRFRDAMCASQHLQATPWHLEMVGRHLLGVPQVAAFV
jgi:alkylation response protein AidB-like acyl-CoA dehydrogenase